MKQVLHVEDDQDFQKLIRILVEGLADIVQTGSYSEAVSLLQKHPYDLVMLDLTLPDGSGMELLDDISKLEQRPKVIIFSMHDVTANIPNVDAVFFKDRFKQEGLVSRLKELLG